MSGDDSRVDEVDIIRRLLQFDEFVNFHRDEWKARNISIKCCTFQVLILSLLLEK